MKTKKKKIGEILIENKLITPAILNEALEYQSKFGGAITQYLVAYHYITEEDIAKSICQQFGFPYLPLRYYNIPNEVINLVPSAIAEKYLLMPIDRVKNILTVVMVDPLNDDAIQELEKITGCSVQTFIGLISDVVKAIERYYHVVIEDKKFKEQKLTPLFINTADYKGFERRESIRLKAKIDIHYPVQDVYKKSKIKDVSMHGFLFESENILPVGAYVTLEINLPREFSVSPIAAVVQVRRVVPLRNKKFDIGAKLVRMLKEDINIITKYAKICR